jgi:hypothetical protein
VSETVTLRVELQRDGSPQPGVRLVLRGSEDIATGPAEALRATTDEQGVAIFEIPSGPVLNRYPLRVAAIGEELSGQSRVTLDVVAGAPVRVEVDPNPLVLSAGVTEPAVLTATAFDRFGNRVARASLTLRPRAVDPNSGARPPLPEEITRTTDENGTAPFIVQAASVPAGYLLEVSSGGVVLASVPVRSLATAPGREGRPPPNPEPKAVRPEDLRPSAELDPRPEVVESALQVDTAAAIPDVVREPYEWVGPPEVADQIRPLKRRAEEAMARGDNDQALSLYREIVGLAPEDPVAWFELGRSLGLAGHWEEARSVFIHAADLDRVRRRTRP